MFSTIWKKVMDWELAPTLKAAMDAGNFAIANVKELGIGLTPATALLDLAAGTTLKAQMRWRPGVMPVAPNDGDMWSDAGGVYFQKNGSPANLTIGGTATALLTDLADVSPATHVAGAVAYHTASALSHDSAKFFYNDALDRLAIGHNSPDETLDVNGRIRLRTASGTGAGGWYDGNATTKRMFFGMDASSDTKSRMYSAPKAANVMVVDLPTGNIAIGGGTPAAKLDVDGELAIKDGMTAPAATAGKGKFYIDVADGDLKMIFGDGTIKTIVTD